MFFELRPITGASFGKLEKVPTGVGAARGDRGLEGCLRRCELFGLVIFYRGIGCSDVGLPLLLGLGDFRSNFSFVAREFLLGIVDGSEAVGFRRCDDGRLLYFFRLEFRDERGVIRVEDSPLIESRLDLRFLGWAAESP